MFKLASKRQVLWPVVIEEPDADGTGQTTESHVKVLYELMGRKDAQHLEDNPKDGPAMLASKIKGWEGIEDDNGPIEYSPETVNALLDIPFVERAFTFGLLQASNGAPVKNLKAGSGG